MGGGAQQTQQSNFFGPRISPEDLKGFQAPRYVRSSQEAPRGVERLDLTSGHGGGGGVIQVIVGTNVLSFPSVPPTRLPQPP